MKKKLNKSLSRIKKGNPELIEERDDVKKLSPLEISVFRSLQKKYDLSIQSQNNAESLKQDSTEINESTRKTLDRINKGQAFTFNEK